MNSARWGRWRRFAEAVFPERHIYLRSNGAVHGLVLTTGRQLMLSGALALLALWTGIGTASMLIGVFSAGPSDRPRC